MEKLASLISLVTWKRAFWAFAVLILVLMARLSLDYGIIWDEWIQGQYGRHVLSFILTGGQDQTALKFGQTMYLYGGLFDTLSATIYGLLFDSVKVVSLYPQRAEFVVPHWFDVRHVLNSLFGALTILFTGLTARKIGNWRAGLIAMTLLLLSPRFFGNSMNNPKDIPFAMASMLAVYGMIRLALEFPKPKIKTLFSIAVGLALALNIKAGALLLFFYLWLLTGILWLKSVKAKEGVSLFSVLRFLLPVSLIGYFAGLLVWPYGLLNPLAHPLAAMQSFTQFSGATGQLLFEGILYTHGQTPWYYLPKWIFISNPLFFIVGIVLLLFFAKDLWKNYPAIVLNFLLFCALFPVLYAILKHSVIYDSWRHFLFIYPPLIVLIALVWDTLFIKTRGSSYKTVVAIIFALQIAEPLSWMIKNHPNEYTYFNPLAGGLRGAYGRYETDYWGNCFRKASEWVIRYHQSKNAPGERIYIRSEGELISSAPYLISGFGPFYASAGPSSENWAYKLEFSRSKPAEALRSGAWPGPDAIYQVEADGIPLCAVIQKK